jgi:phenylpyruvate tautomerase
MPLLRITTNVQTDRAASEKLTTAFSAVVSKLLGKPESYVMVILEQDAAMSFAGLTDPCAYLELKSLGLPESRSVEFSAALCDMISDKLGVDSSRTYIEFSSPARHLWGWDRQTF